MTSSTKLGTATLCALALALAGCFSTGEDVGPLPRVVTPEQARAAEAAGQHARAAELWHRVYVDTGGEQLEPYLGCGRALLATGDARSACAIVQQGLEVFPREIELHLLHAEILDEAGFQRAAERAYEHAVALDPDDHAAELGLGRVRLQLGLSHKALGPLRRAATIDPDDHESLRLFAIAAEDAGDVVDAFAARRRLLLLEDEPSAYRYVTTARLTFDPEVRTAFPYAAEMAQPWIARAIELDPQDSEAHYLTARDLEERGEVERSRAAYRRAIEVDPGNLAALSDLAAQYHREGLSLEADRFARLALDLEDDRRRREVLATFLVTEK